MYFPTMAFSRPRAAMTIAMLLFVSAPANAADVEQCMTASQRGQAARAEGHLRVARDNFGVCTSDTCPAVIRRDCARWQEELSAAIPTVVLSAKDSSGRDLIDVTASIDGSVVAEKLDGKAIAVDPGAHTMKFEVKDRPPVEQQALIREGEKIRVISVTIPDVTPAPGKDPAKTEPVTPPPETERKHTVYPWIVVGVGAVALGVGAVIFATAPDLPPTCNADTRRCSAIPNETPDQSAARAGDAKDSQRRPPQGLVLGGAGLLLIAGGLIWHFVEPTGPAKTAKLQWSPWASTSSGGLAVQGGF